MAEGLDPLKSDEDVEEILRLAVRSAGIDGGATLRDRLVNSANELGISPEALAAAESQWMDQRRGQINAEQDRFDRKLFKKLRFGAFVQHLGAYLAVNGFLTWIDLKGDHRLDWAMWPAMGWGIAIVIHGFSLLAHSHDDERDYQRWLRKKYRVDK